MVAAAVRDVGAFPGLQFLGIPLEFRGFPKIPCDSLDVPRMPCDCLGFAGTSSVFLRFLTPYQEFLKFPWIPIYPRISKDSSSTYVGLSRILWESLGFLVISQEFFGVSGVPWGPLGLLEGSSGPQEDPKCFPKRVPSYVPRLMFGLRPGVQMDPQLTSDLLQIGPNSSPN